MAEGRKSIHGTATCLPPTGEMAGLPDAPVLEPVAVLPGVVPVALVPVALVKEITANSSRPETGLTMVSLMAPTSLPEELVI